MRCPAPHRPAQEVTHRCALLAVTALLVTPLQAWAKPVNADLCHHFAKEQVGLAHQADPKACPEFMPRRDGLDGLFHWCMKQRSAERVQNELDMWDGKLVGCMSAIEAAKTEKALADAERKAKADAVVGSYDQRWQKGLNRMRDLGMTKPLDRRGHEVDARSTEAKRLGVGLLKDQQLGFYAVCNTCKGLTMRLLDPKGRVIEQVQSKGNAVDMTAYPTVSGNGSIEFTVTNCQSKADSCKLRYTSFTL